MFKSLHHPQLDRTVHAWMKTNLIEFQNKHNKQAHDLSILINRIKLEENIT